MLANDDLMRRLAAADPLPDTERLDPQAEREAEALLARLLATPPERHAAQRGARHPQWRRRTVAVAGFACVVAITLVAFILIDADAPGPGIEQAVAAKAAAAVSQ